MVDMPIGTTRAPTRASLWRGGLDRGTGLAGLLALHPPPSASAGAKRSTSSCAVRSRACHRSWAVCIPSQVSGVEPNALRQPHRQLPPETPARSFTSSESAWRVTPKPCAARVTDNPRGSTHSRFTIPPGCGGECLGVLSLSLARFRRARQCLSPLVRDLLRDATKLAYPLSEGCLHVLDIISRYRIHVRNLSARNIHITCNKRLYPWFCRKKSLKI